MVLASTFFLDFGYPQSYCIEVLRYKFVPAQSCNFKNGNSMKPNNMIISGFFIKLKLNDTQNSYRMYKKFINTKLPHKPQPALISYSV